MEESQNWKTEFSGAFKKASDLYQFLGWEIDPAVSLVAEKYPIFVPQTLAEKIKSLGPESALARQFLPNSLEMTTDTGFDDPIGDKKFLKAPQLIHRYPSRALFTPTSICPVHCRYCFRKNELNSQDEIFHQDFLETKNYLISHPEISEIIFTGGDPFTLSTEKLKTFLSQFAEIKSIKDIRFHTRYSVTLPSRFDDELISMLESFKDSFRTISIALHINHASEITEQAEMAIKGLGSFQLLSQTVLLKDVNDSTEALIDLYDRFISLNIRPYYLHHPDQVKGGMHFYVALEEGRKIYHSLRGKLPGWALPQYIIDVPGGHGKIPAANPESFSYSGKLLSGSSDLIDSPER